MKVWHRVAADSARALIVSMVVALAALGAVLLGTAGPASAAAAPSFEPDPASKGSVSFYDASGTQITSGSINDNPLAAYYGASGGALNVGDTLAFVSYATPQDGVATLSWSSNESWTGGQTFGAGVTYPGSLAGTSNAVVKGANTDGAFSVHIAAFASASTLDPGVYQVRLYTSGTQVTTYYSSDILVSGSTWTQIYPAVVTGTPTTTVLAASPLGHQAPAGTVDLTATVTPSGAAGTVQFKDGGANLGAPVAVAAGTAQLSTAALATGAHSLTAAFTPTDPTAFAASTSIATSYLVGTVPGAPTILTPVAGNTAATVSWIAPADTGGLPIAGYDVQYSTDGSTWTHASSAFHTSTATTQQVTGLVNGTGYQFEVAAINAIGTGAYSAPSVAVSPVADPSKVTQAKSAAIKYGTATTISAKLTDTKTAASVAGVGVRLLVRTSSAKPFVFAKTVPTNASGVAALVVKPTVNTQYEWVFPGNATHAAATSGVEAVSVAQAVSIRTTKTRLRHGTVLKLWGGVAPAASGQYVVLQKHTATGWHTVTKVKLVRQKLPNGSTTVGYVFTLRPSSAGRPVFRVYRAPTASNASGVSASLTISVS